MHSYRHNFHAGGQADVVKHTLLLELSKYMSSKDKPYVYIDTHTGPAEHDLIRGHFPSQEFAVGAGSLLAIDKQINAEQHTLLRQYLDLLGFFNQEETPNIYPGSSTIASHFFRNKDRMFLFESHPTDGRKLLKHYARAPRVIAEIADGYQGLLRLLPSTPRRALVLIDPSYELKTDYAQTYQTLKQAYIRMATAVIAVWYPLVVRQECRELQRRFVHFPASNWLHAQLHWRKSDIKRLGMFGCGMYIINPPYTLPKQVEQMLLFLSKHFAQDDHAGFELDFKVH